MPRPNSAVMRGSPIATTDPKVMSRMMAAAIRPMPSDPAATVRDLVATGPPASTCKLESPAARIGSTRALASAAVNSSADLSKATSAYAVVPSAEIWCAPSGVNGLDHAHDVLGGGDVGEDLLDSRLDPVGRDSRVGVDDDLERAAGLLREVGLQRVRDLLRLGSRLEVVLFELASEGAGHGEGPDQGGHPSENHQATPPVAPISETYQHENSSRFEHRDISAGSRTSLGCCGFVVASTLGTGARRHDGAGSTAKGASTTSRAGQHDLGEAGSDLES